MVDMCHHTQSDYQASNPPLRLTVWMRGLWICHTTNGEGGGMLLLFCLSLLLYAWDAMQTWIRFVAFADVRKDSCCQDVQNHRPIILCHRCAVPDNQEPNPVSLFCLLHRVSLTSLVLTLAHHQTTPVFIFVWSILGEKSRLEQCAANEQTI